MRGSCLYAGCFAAVGEEEIMSKLERQVAHDARLLVRHSSPSGSTDVP